MREDDGVDDLVAWLRGVLDDEGRIARAAKEADPTPWIVRDQRVGTLAHEDAPLRSLAEGDGVAARYCEAATAAHIARQDPAATLARIAAHRALLGLLDHRAEVGIRAGTDYYVACTCGWETEIPDGLSYDDPFEKHLLAEHGRMDPATVEAMLRLLASAYAHLPGYDERWRP